MKLQCGENKRK